MSVRKKGKSVTFEVRAWWNTEDQMIHLASDASKTFILTVCDDPKDAPKKRLAVTESSFASGQNS